LLGGSPAINLISPPLVPFLLDVNGSQFCNLLLGFLPHLEVPAPVVVQVGAHSEFDLFSQHGQTVEEGAVMWGDWIGVSYILLNLFECGFIALRALAMISPSYG
jgi:hypothetical protein